MMGDIFADAAKERLTRHEGIKYRPYKCPTGHLTIGVGHNLDAAPLPEHMAEHLRRAGGLTPDMVGELFEADFQGAIRDCRRLWPGFDGFTNARKDALVNFMFNLGITRVRKFVNTNMAINSGRWGDAADGIRKSLYWKQLGGDPPGMDDGRKERPEEIYEMIKNG
jgi:lysozyme